MVHNSHIQIHLYKGINFKSAQYVHQGLRYGPRVLFAVSSILGMHTNYGLIAHTDSEKNDTIAAAHGLLPHSSTYPAQLLTDPLDPSHREVRHLPYLSSFYISFPTATMLESSISPRSLNNYTRYPRRTVNCSNKDTMPVAIRTLPLKHHPKIYQFFVARDFFGSLYVEYAIGIQIRTSLFEISVPTEEED